MLLTEWLEHALAVADGQVLVVLDLADQVGQDPAHRGAGHRMNPGPERDPQVTAQRSGVGQRLLAAEFGQEGVQRQRVLG